MTDNQHSSWCDRFFSKGDGQQTGGIFVVGPGVKKALKYSFREADAEPTEFADLEKIYEACGGSGPLNFGEAEADEHSDVKAEEKMGEEMETGVMAEAKNDDKAEKEAGLCAGIEEPAAKTQEKEEEDGHETKMHTEEWTIIVLVWSKAIGLLFNDDSGDKCFPLTG